MRLLLFGGVIGFFLVCGCGVDSEKTVRSSPDQADGNVLPATNGITEQFLRERIITGMSQAALTEILGNPASTLRFDDGTILLDYIFPYAEIPGPRRLVLSGIGVFLTNDTVLRWSPSYNSVGGNEVIKTITRDTRADDSLESKAELTFWVVSERPIEGGRYIDTPQFPKVGFISGDPNLRVTRLKTLRERTWTILNKQNEEVEDRSLGIVLTDEDAPAFETLTRENEGKKLLVMVGQMPVMAARVTSVISGGAFMFGHSDPGTFVQTRDALAKLLP